MSPSTRRRPLPGLTLQQLEYLVAVSEAPTWAAAAAELGVTPSALSQGLAELERRLGLRLFEREGRRRVLAAPAAAVLDYARRVVHDTADLTRHLEDLERGHAGRYRLGMIDVAALGHWPHVLERLSAGHSGLELELTVAPSASLLEAVSANLLDLAVVVAPAELPPDLLSTDLLVESLAVYAPPGVDHAEVSDWGPWVLFPPTSNTRHLIDRALTGLGVDVRVTSESHQPEVLKEMVVLGLGWTVLPIIQGEQGSHPLQRARPEPLLERRLVAVRRRSGLPHPLDAQLLDWLGHREEVEGLTSAP